MNHDGNKWGWTQIPILLSCLFTCNVTAAAEYIIGTPELNGIHGTAPYTAVDVTVVLPTAFSTIQSASLRLTGEHFSGSTASLLANQGGPIGAVL